MATTATRPGHHTSATRPSRPARRAGPIGIFAAALLLVTGSYLVRLVADGPPPGGSDVDSGSNSAVDQPAGGLEPGAVSGVSGGAAAGTGQVTLAELDERIRTWSVMAALDDADYLSATNLGVLYLGRARLSADLSDYERSAEATARALAAFPDYGPARALDATVRFATHDFDGALAAARSLLADEPGNADALAVVGDASLELGRIDEAAHAYASLGSLTPGPALDVRLARLAYVAGDPDRALAIARDARDDALASGVADDAFYHYQLGEFARLAGDAGLARAGFAAALDVRSANIPALIGLARVDAAEGRLDVAAASLERAMAIAPQPEVLGLLGDIRAMQGEAGAAADPFATVRLTATLGELAGSVYDRQLLAFELDHGGASEDVLAAARASAAARPDAAGHDLVAWALHRLGRHEEAAIESSAALATGIEDARVTFHAGAIALATGDSTGGEALLRSALARGAALDPVERAEAERLLAGG